MIQDTIKNKTFVDLSQVLPSQLSGLEYRDLIEKSVFSDKVRLLPDDQHACSVEFLLSCIDSFKKVMEEKACKDVRAGKKPPGMIEEKKTKPAAPLKAKGGKRKNKK